MLFRSKIFACTKFAQKKRGFIEVVENIEPKIGGASRDCTAQGVLRACKLTDPPLGSIDPKSCFAESAVQKRSGHNFSCAEKTHINLGFSPCNCVPLMNIGLH